MISRKKWKVRGKAVKIKQRKRGIWLTVIGTLSNDSYSQLTTIDCWLPAFLDDKRRNYNNKFNVSGVLVFEGKDTYFLTEEII